MVTVGIGRAPGALGGITLAGMEAELRRLREEYNAPDDARFCQRAPGSIYAGEFIWVEGVEE